MARDVLQKKQRVAHNKTDGKNHEMLYEESDFLPSFLEHIRSNDFSALHLNNLEPSVSGTNETFVKQKTHNIIPISTQNRTSVPTSKKPRTTNRFKLMEKVNQTFKQIKHNTHNIPKPKAHLSTFSNSPLELNSHSSNNNSISLEKSKETKIVRKDLKNTCNNMQNKNTEESERVDDFNKTGHDTSDSDNAFETFVAKNRPKKSKREKDSRKKPQKSTKIAKKRISKSTSVNDFIVNDEIAKKHIPKSTSSVSDFIVSDDSTSSENEYNMSGDETSASSESDSNASDDDETFAPSKQRNKNCKKTKKRREVLNNRQSTSKRKHASQSFKKKENSRTFSKCASQESDSDMSDETSASSESDSNASDETFAPSKQRNKNCKKTIKRHEVQSTSKRKNASQSLKKKVNSRTFSKCASQERDSDMSDDTQSCYYTRRKRIKNNNVFDKRQSTERDNASESIVKKRNSRTLSKSAPQESDFDMSDDKSSYHTRSKRMKMNKDMENRQSTSKMESDSDMVNVDDYTYDTDSSDLPPPAEIFAGSKSNTCHSQSSEERNNLDNQESKFSSPDEICIASSIQFPVLHKTSNHKSMGVNDQSYGLFREESSLKTLVDNGQSNSKCFPTKNGSISLGVNDQSNALLKEESSLKTSFIDNSQSNSKCFPTKNGSISLDVNDQSNALLKEESSLKTSFVDNSQSNSKCFPTKNGSLSLVVNDQPNVLLKEKSSLKPSLVDNDQSNSQCFTTKNSPALNNCREDDPSKSPVVDLTESDIECESSFSIMPQIIKIEGRIPNESVSHSEESEIELIDVIVHELPEKSKTSSSSKKVGSKSSNDSTIKPVNVDQILSCNNAKPQNTPEIQTSLNGKNEAAYSTGICQDYNEKAECKDMTAGQFNLNKDKAESSIVNNAVSTLISSKEVKEESHNDCEIVLDIISTNNSNQNLPVAQTCNNEIIKAEKGSKSVKEVIPIGVAKSGSITKEQSNQNSIVSHTENSLTLSRNIKKEGCGDDCEIILDIATNSNQNLPGVQICNNSNMERDSKTIKGVTPIAVATSCSISKEQSIQSSSNTEDSLLISSKNMKKEPCDDCEIVLDITSTNNSNQNLPGVQIFNNTNVKMEKDSKTIEKVTPIGVAKSCSISKEQSMQSCSKTEDSLISSKNIKKDPCDDDCEIVPNIAFTDNLNKNLPEMCSNIKIENCSKAVEPVTPVHVINSGLITTEQNKLSQNEQKVHEVENSNLKNLTASRNETSEHLEKEKMNELDSEKIKILLERVKKELATYQEIIETEETVQNTFKSLERRQAEKLMALKNAIIECMQSDPSISECNSIKNAVNKLLDSSELISSSSLRNCFKVPSVCDNVTSTSGISVQDLKTFATMNLVPLSSIPENDIKPSLSDLQYALKQQPSTSARRNSIDRNWSFGQKCMVCAKDATSACQNCCKVFFCSDECGVKYWEGGHKNACKYL